MEYSQEEIIENINIIKKEMSKVEQSINLEKMRRAQYSNTPSEVEKTAKEVYKALDDLVNIWNRRLTQME